MAYGPDHWLGLDTWVTSDHHWGHGNIRVYQNRPDDHYELMYRLWNETVGEDDDLLHLGDLVWGCQDADFQPPWLDSLNGRKRLIRGNHDKCSTAWYREAGFEPIGYGNKAVRTIAVGDLLVAFSHVPLDRRVHDGVGWDVNVHGHIHANPLWYPIEGKIYHNASVEVTAFAPRRLRDYLGIPAETTNMGGP